jgi:glycine/D-amino acid oxidase-like deaminating enzyme
LHIGFRLDEPAARVVEIAPRLSINASPPKAEPRSSIPSKVDVAIVGGGIVGITTALELARRRVSVALFEKGRLGGEQSSRNWGWCRQIGRDRRELPLAELSLRLWRDLALAKEPHLFDPCGIVYLAGTNAQAERFSAYLDELGPKHSSARLLTNGEIAELVPGTARTWLSAVHSSHDGRADPDLALTSLVEAARCEGVQLFTNCAVHGFETTAGRVSALVTDLGRIVCDSLVVAAGAWSSVFCKRHRISLPQIKVVSSVLSTTAVESGPKTCVFGDGFTFGRQRDGGYVVGHGGIAILPLGPDVLQFAKNFLPALRQEWNFVSSYVRPRVNRLALEDWRDRGRSRLGRANPKAQSRELSPEPSLDILSDAIARLAAAFPAFRNAQVRKRWAGVMDVTPDGLPVISRVDAVPGLVVGTGFSGHGFGLGPGAGRVLADIATGRDPAVDVAPFRFSRFSDGTPLLPGLRF